MVLDGVVLSLIVGFFRGGSLKGIEKLRLKFGWIFPVFLLIQLVIYFTQNHVELVAQVSTYIFMLVYVLGLFFLWMNRSYTGFGLLFFGVFLNFIVMLVNGGRMPVSLEAASVLDPAYVEAIKTSLYAKHTILTESTRLSFLGDIISLHPPYPRTQVISIGDVIMNIGIFLFIQELMVKVPRSHKTTMTSSEVN